MTKKTVFSAAIGFNGEYTALPTLAALMPRRARALRGVKTGLATVNKPRVYDDFAIFGLQFSLVSSPSPSLSLEEAHRAVSAIYPDRQF
jgi:hypothetical protein